MADLRVSAAEVTGTAGGGLVTVAVGVAPVARVRTLLSRQSDGSAR